MIGGLLLFWRLLGVECETTLIVLLLGYICFCDSHFRNLIAITASQQKPKLVVRAETPSRCNMNSWLQSVYMRSTWHYIVSLHIF
jgi:hypothetical protein